MSFRYNSDIASNMSAASIAIHANDLLYRLEKAMAKSDVSLTWLELLGQDRPY
jgi:sugar diacid utilization regulator